MEKEDLKTGMVVETRVGKRYLVIKNCLNLPQNIMMGDTGWIDLIDYDNDLVMIDEFILLREFDIMKIYTLPVYNIKYINNIDKLKLIWERKEKPQLTERERAYLKAYSYDYEWVARDKESYVCVYVEKPHKLNNCWSDHNKFYTIKEDLFSFIKWEDEEPYKIKDLLGDEDD